MGNICGGSGTSNTLENSGAVRGRQTVPNIKNFTNLKKINKLNDFYALGTELGKGAFGSVYRATRQGMESECALKMVNKKALRRKPNLAELMV